MNLIATLVLIALTVSFLITAINIGSTFLIIAMGGVLLLLLVGVFK